MQPDIIFRKKESTDPAYGKKPSDRNVEELLEMGFVIVDKTIGPSSHRTAQWVRDLLGAKKAGHLGTLDPNVSGVLPILLNNATRAASFLMSQDKEYVCIAEFHKDIKPKEVEKHFSKFIGKITQLPPVKSAVARRERQRNVHSLQILEISGRHVLFKARTQAGTYIRKLVHDIGEASKKGANMLELRRISTGPFQINEAVKLHELAEAVWMLKENGDDSQLRKYILPIDSVLHLMGIKRVWISDPTVDAICSGAQLMAPGIVKADRSIEGNRTEHVAIMTLKDELIALGHPVMSTEQMMDKDSGIAVRSKHVLMKKGTYPSWKKK